MISIIIPIYNLEKYIGQCLESILQQTYQDYELIVVNDGSTDNTMSVLREYVPRFQEQKYTIIDKPNGGVTAARRDGFLAAKGDWVAFVDGDDILPENSLKDLANGIKEGVSVVCGSTINFEDNNVKSALGGHYLKEGIYSNTDCFSMLMFNKLKVVVWGKIYKRDSIKRSMLNIPREITNGEDNIFNYRYFSCNIDNVAFIENVIYKHRKGRKGSADDLMYGEGKINPHYKIGIYKELDSIIDRLPFIGEISKETLSIFYLRQLWKIKNNLSSLSNEEFKFIEKIFKKIEIESFSEKRLLRIIMYYIFIIFYNYRNKN